MRRTVAVVAVLGALAAVPASASAKTYSAYAGNPGKVPRGVHEQTVLNRFFPARLKVRAGDKVRYTALTPHTVSVLAKGTAYPAGAVPAPGETYSGINDPQGQPFFFNGLQKFINNLAVFAPQNSNVVGDGKTHSSGFLLGQGKPATYSLKFARTGSYKVLCLLHPGMVQRVKVLKRRARGADTSTKVRGAVLRQSTKGYGDARKAVKTVVPANTVDVGVERKNATVLSYFPNTLKVPAGTAVNFRMAAPSEVHNMVFGPESFVAPFAAATDKLPIFGSTENQVSPPSVYGSEPGSPAGSPNYTYTGSNYGNGFLWTPVMDMDAASPPPGSERITFTTPGTYTYFCAIHGSSMHGTVVVQ